ncbi:hypothetical protein C4553_01120 [Candidatus Parcubacteria bacterium]|nr:MAG: hypothetical protein C4553_01120 [Candidatus Parcubacteria bacterium]
MKGRFLLLTMVCIISLLSFIGCTSRYLNKDLGMPDWDDENTIRVARILSKNPRHLPEKPSKSGSLLIRYDAVYDETEGLLFIYGKFWGDTKDVQTINYYAYDPNTRILLEAIRPVDLYKQNSTPRELEALNKMFTPEHEADLPPVFGYGSFFGYDVWYVFNDTVAKALKDQIDYAVKCKRENITRDFLSTEDTVHLKWFDIGPRLFVYYDSLMYLDSVAIQKELTEIRDNLFRKDELASVHLYSKGMIKQFISPAYYAPLAAEIDQIKFEWAEQARAAELKRIQQEKDEIERARIAEQQRIQAEKEKKAAPGLFATKMRMLKFKASVLKDEEFVKEKCGYDPSYTMSGTQAAGIMRALKELYAMDVNCRSGCGFWVHGTLKTTFDGWQAISQEINVGHLQYVIADKERRIKITDGTNYVSLYIDVSDIKNCHVVDAKLPDIGEHVFTIMGKKSAVQIKRNASIELLNVVYHKDFEKRGTDFIEFAENAILEIETRQEILDSGYKLKRAGKL